MIRITAVAVIVISVAVIMITIISKVAKIKIVIIMIVAKIIIIMKNIRMTKTQVYVKSTVPLMIILMINEISLT